MTTPIFGLTNQKVLATGLQSELMFGVSSRDCLIASDKLFCHLFRSWFRNPQKVQKLGEKVSEKLHFKLWLDLKRTETRQG